MFKRGNIVEIIRGYEGSINDPDVGKICVVYESKQVGNDIRYGILECSTGLGSAWWYEDRLEFVAEGGEEEIRKVLETRKRKVG